MAYFDNLGSTGSTSNNYHFKNIQELVDAFVSHPDDPVLKALVDKTPMASALAYPKIAQNRYENGEIGANDLLHEYSENGEMSPEQEKWLDNEIARENTQQQQNFEIQARDTSLLSTASQLEQLGLSSSNVVQLGGASAGVQGSTADTSHMNTSALRQQERINKFNQIMGIGKSLIGAASSMASSGIYGSAIGAVKHSAQQLTAAAAHSGLQALDFLKRSSKPLSSRAERMKYLLGE